MQFLLVEKTAAKILPHVTLGRDSDADHKQ
jgi:hypothetical protein